MVLRWDNYSGTSGIVEFYNADGTPTRKIPFAGRAGMYKGNAYGVLGLTGQSALVSFERGLIYVDPSTNNLVVDTFWGGVKILSSSPPVPAIKLKMKESAY